MRQVLLRAHRSQVQLEAEHSERMEHEPSNSGVFVGPPVSGGPTGGLSRSAPASCGGSMASIHQEGSGVIPVTSSQSVASIQSGSSLPGGVDQGGYSRIPYDRNRQEAQGKVDTVLTMFNMLHVDN